MKQYTHINQHHIRKNIKLPPEERLPVVTSKTYKENNYFNNAELVCKDTGKVVAKVVYSPDKPLSCGSRLFILTDTDDIEIREMTDGDS